MPSWFKPNLKANSIKSDNRASIDQYIAFYLAAHYLSPSDICPFLLAELKLETNCELEGNREEFFKLCKRKLANIKNAPINNWEWPDNVLNNLGLIQEGLKFSDEEIATLFFFFAIGNLKTTNSLVDDVGKKYGAKTHVIIAGLFGQDIANIKAVLSRNGRLHQYGFLEEEVQSYGFPFDIDDQWSNILQRQNDSFESLFDEFFYTKKHSGLNRNNYPHLKKSIDDICSWLTEYCPKNSVGRNILLYGPPGTGKTELASLIANETGQKAYTLLECTDNRMDEHKRLGKLAFGQEILKSHSSSYLIIDEIEDVIGGSFLSQLSGKKKPEKSVLNRRLEDNKTPTIWISNDVGHLDPAYIRRFDLVIKVDIPPLPVRKKIIEDASKGALSDNFIRKVAEHGNIAPAIVSDAVKVAQGIKSQKKDIEDSVIRTINGKLEISGEQMKFPRTGPELPYRTDVLNTSIPLDFLAEQLHSESEARLCLYGPPGTGKSRFARYLSQKINVPLISKKASSLLSPWVGGTEENIALSFSEAESTGSILLIDEADSFLQDRSKSHAHWEVTQVNELLHQMENYRGILICTTNLYDSLDRASLRRFDIKVRYDYLDETQRVRMFDDLVDTIGIKNNDIQRHRIAKIENLAPGDFAAALRACSIYKNQVTTEQLTSYLLEATEHNI